MDSTLNALRASPQMAGLVVCGTSMSSVTVTRASGLVVFGDPYTSACRGNQISDASLASNTKGVTLFANNLSGDLTVYHTTGGPTIVGGNFVGRTLNCTADDPPAVNGGHPNSAQTRKGECAAANF